MRRFVSGHEIPSVKLRHRSISTPLPGRFQFGAGESDTQFYVSVYGKRPALSAGAIIHAPDGDGIIQGR